MVLDNRNVLSAIRKIVSSNNKQPTANKTIVKKRQGEAEAGNKQLFELEAMGLLKKTSVKLDVDDEEQDFSDLCDAEKELIHQTARQKMAQRKRVVSECASVIADPSQASGQPPGCLKWRTWLPTLLRVPCLLVCLYFFICSLEMLSSSFRLMAGKTAGSIFRENPLLMNPVVGLMMGVLFTVLVQSSSTCTSVIVSMVASGVLEVRSAIPMIMGANIGTSLTNTLVSFSQVTERDQFERAFAGATVHDCFNWLTVFVLLTFEVCTGYLYHLTGWLTKHLEMDAGGSDFSLSSVNILGVITKPLTHKIIQIDKSVLKCWALGGCQDQRLLKVWCSEGSLLGNMTLLQNTTESMNETREACNFILNIDSLSDFTLGLILFGISLGSLSACLIFIVKLLHSLLQGTVAELAKKTINSEVPGAPWLSGYIAIFAGALLTFLVQSSSVFTSTITPLVGLGLISVDRMYPLTLGSNIGTTTTALLASLSAEPSMLRSSLQIALCHLTFNLHGILLFYPVPAMRWPLVMCKILGRTTAQYRWFAIVYLLFMFALVPGFVLSLSLAGGLVLTFTLVPILLTVLLIIIINVVQSSSPSFLPPFLRSWDFLPEWMRSLDPLDRTISRFGCIGKYSEIPNPAADNGDVFVGVSVQN